MPVLSVEEYVQCLDNNVKEKFLELRKIVLDSLDYYEELINYGLPSYRLVEGAKADRQVMIGAASKHVAIYPHPGTIEAFKDELTGFKTSKGTIRFTLTEELPADLIHRMISFLQEEALKKSSSETNR